MGREKNLRRTLKLRDLHLVGRSSAAFEPPLRRFIFVRLVCRFHPFLLNLFLPFRDWGDESKYLNVISGLALYTGCFKVCTAALCDKIDGLAKITGSWSVANHLTSQSAFRYGCSNGSKTTRRLLLLRLAP